MAIAFFVALAYAEVSDNSGRPAMTAIKISDVKIISDAIRYQAEMLVTNSDATWTASQVCVHVRFRDQAKASIDAHQTDCFGALKPQGERKFSVMYTGALPKETSVIVEAQVSSVKWVK
jgi:hypothetical protein